MQNSDQHVPKWADRFLKWFCAPNLLEEVQGDIYEAFAHNVQELGEKKARRRFIADVLLFFNYSTIKGNRQWKGYKLYFPMYQHYFKITFRLFAKNKLYILINTLGLGIALACCINAYLLFAYNIEFDQFHQAEKVSNIFKVHTHLTTKTGLFQENNSAPSPLAPEAASEIAGINRYTRFIQGSGYIQDGDKGFQDNFGFADSTFFEMFDFPLVYGNHKYFKDKYAIFLSTELSQKIFGKIDPTGKTLTLHFPNEKEFLVTVGGVVDKIPVNSTFVYNAIMRFEHYLDIHEIKPNDWANWRNPSTFFELASVGNASLISEQLEKYIAVRNEARPVVKVNTYQLEPFHSKITSEEIWESYVNMRMSIAAPVIFGSMALMILLIACFNLTNTSIAMSTKRLKEIGVRKAIGAARSQIVAQFLSETTVIMAISLLIGVVIARWFLLPEFDAMFNLGYSLEDLSGLNLFIGLILVLVAASLLAGIYPALFNSRLHPVALVKGAIKIKGTNWLTRTLTSVQFALTVIFLIAGVIFFQNIQFQKKIAFGYEKDQLIMLNIPGEKAFNIMENALSSNPKIRSIAGSYSHVGYNSWRTPVEIGSQVYDTKAMGIGKNYLKTIGLNIIEGTDLSEDQDFDSGKRVIVNKAFIEKAGLEKPLDKMITMEGGKRRIVGIVDNHLDGLESPKEAESFIYIMVEPKKYAYMVINTKASDLTTTFKAVENTWRETFPNRPFYGLYQEDILLGGHRQLTINLGKIFLFLTILGTIMSIAGIFSLASLNIARRTKEIGIRKVLGATKGSILTLINREFTIILSIAAIFGSLGGFVLTNNLLSFLYKHHIAVGLIPVFLCTLLIFGAGYITTSSSILKAASANPVDALRSE